MESGFLKRVWVLVLLGLFAYGCGTIGFIILRYQYGEQLDTVAFANNFVPWWGLGALVAAVIAAFSRWRWLLIAVQIPMLALFVNAYGGMFWPRGSSAEAHDGLALRVANYNTLSALSDPEQVIEIIRDIDADVIGLEEVGIDLGELLKEEFADEYPYMVLHPAPSDHGTALLSRYPVLNEDVYYPFYKYVRHNRILLDIDGTTVAVYVAHPHTPDPLFPPTAYDVSLREDELDALYDQVRDETLPVLAVCDCNMTDQSDSYHKLRSLLTDSFREAGWGFGFTYPARNLSGKTFFPRMIRIDYIWHSEEFVATDADVWHDSGTSDHRPIVANLVLKQDPEN